MQGYRKLLLMALFAIILIPLNGQNTDSPYSRYGYGVLNNQSIGASKSMGGVSYGLRGLSTNPGNPASYSAVDSLTFMFDLGISYRNSRLSEGGVSKGYDNGGLDYIAMQFLLSKKLGMSIGLLPFSSVGYSFGSVERENVVNTRSYTGEGGLSQIYGGLGYEPIKNLSVGANVSYIWGNTTYTRSLNIGINSANGQRWYHKMTVNMLKLDFGAQYTLGLNKNDNITLGLVFSPKVNATGKITRIDNGVNSQGSLLPGDTITYTGSNAYTDLPNKLGAGFVWKHKNNLILAFDATYEDWSKARFSTHVDDDLDLKNRFNDTWRFNGGFEYTIDPKDRNFIKRVKFRGGLSYNNSYINVMDSQGSVSGYKEYGATLGFGLPIRDTYTNRTSYINIGFEYKNLKPNNASLIKEQFFGVSLGIALNDLWFLKNKFR